MPVKNSLILVTVATLCACGSTESDPKSSGAGAGGVSGSAGSGGSSGQGGTSAGGNGGGGASSGGGSGEPGGGGAGEGSGGTSTGGGSGGNPTGGGAGDGSGPVTGMVGTTCSPPGTLACAGNYQKLTVVCGADGTWQPNQTCGANEFCDSTEGPNAGTCQPQLPECAAGPGTRFCRDRSTLVECGADAVTVALRECLCLVDECGEDGADPCADSEDFADIVNCASDCGASECSVDNCNPALDSITSLPAVFRAPGANEGCACEGSQRRYMGFVFPYKTAYRVTVPEPWAIATVDQCAATPVRCFVGDTPEVTGTVAAFFAITDDPTAPPRNVLIEQVEPGAECPPE